jgi:hypothetical protein
MVRKLGIIFVLISLACIDASAVRPSFGRRGLTRNLGRRSESEMANIWHRDLSRDHATPPKILSRDRMVNRYTTLPRAKAEARGGLSSGTHLTSRVSPGRPLSALSAQNRLGLLIRPEAREKVLLKQGTSVRFNKALGGKPGVGEITIVTPAPKTVLRDVRRIR